MDRNLFTRHDGSPMCFSLIPCPERKEIREMIEYGGGILVQPGVDQRAIKLAPAGSSPAVEDDDDAVFSTEFVRECRKRELLLPLRHFTVRSQRLPGEEVEDAEDESDAACRAGALRSTRVRRDFSLGEDITIAKFMANEPGPIRGNEVYKRLERSGLVGRHTWQSLKEHYLKKIYPAKHLYESPASTKPCGPRGAPARPREDKCASSFLGSGSAPATRDSTVAASETAVDGDERGSSAASTCSSQVVPETDQDSLPASSSCPQDGRWEGGSTQPFVPSVTGAAGDKLPESRRAASDENNTVPFIPHLSSEGGASTESRSQSPDAPPRNSADGTGPFIVVSLEGQAVQVASQENSLGTSDDTSSETVIVGTSTDGSSGHSSVFAPLTMAPRPPPKQDPDSQRDDPWPSLSDLGCSQGDFELIRGKLVDRSSQTALGSLGDPHLASFPDFPSQDNRPSLEPGSKFPDARVFPGESSCELPRASQCSSDWARMGVVSGQRRPVAKDVDERDFSLRKAGTACSRVYLASGSQAHSSACHTGSQRISDGADVLGDDYETTSGSASPSRTVVDSLLDLLMTDSSLGPKPKVKIVNPIVSSDVQQCSQSSQRVQASNRVGSPSLLENRDCEMEVEALQPNAKLNPATSSDMSLTLGAGADEMLDRPVDIGRPRSPRRPIRPGTSSRGTTSDRKMECEQPGPSGRLPSRDIRFALREGSDLDSCDDAIVRKKRIAKPSRVAVIASSDDDDEDTAPKQPKPPDKGVLEQHQRNLELMLDMKKTIERKWRRQRPHKRCPPDCMCPQSSYYTRMLRLIVSTRAILAFHDCLDADPEACAAAILSELVERHRSGQWP